MCDHLPVQSARSCRAGGSVKRYRREERRAHRDALLVGPPLPGWRGCRHVRHGRILPDGAVTGRQPPVANDGSNNSGGDKSGNSIHFGSSVNIQTPLNEMESGCAIVFELRHYKPLRKKQSVRVWSFMDLEEFRDKEGAIALEIYAKPADYLRRPRSLRLFSRKPLYFHVTLHHRQF